MFERDSYVNMTDANGKSAFSYTLARPCSPVIVNTFIDQGADPLVGIPSGPSIISKLLTVTSRGPGSSKQDIEDIYRAVESLLSHGEDPKAQDENGRTLVHILIINRTEDDFNLLLNSIIYCAAPCDRTSFVNATDTDGKSAMSHALTKPCCPRIVNELLELNTDPFVGVPTTDSSIVHIFLTNFADGRIHDCPRLVVF